MLEKGLKRKRRQNKIRKKISWTAKRPRLSIFRSNTNISAQLIDDVSWKTLWSASDIKTDKKNTKTEKAVKVWTEIADAAKNQKIKEIVFDRWGFAYHGRVKALADAAREAWLKF